MASFRLVHSLTRRPVVRPRQPCTRKPPKARKASWGFGRVPSSSYDKIRNALADYLAQDDTSTTPPGPPQFDEPTTPARDPKAPREPSDEALHQPFDRAAHRPFDKPARKPIFFDRTPGKPFLSYGKAYTPIAPEGDITSSATDHKPYRKPYGSYGKPFTRIAPKTETSSKEDIAPETNTSGKQGPPPETYARDATDLCSMKFSAAGLFGIPKAKGPTLPLRILFCGSDEFSCESLKALYAEHFRSRKLIRSIDVVVRPAKPTGRGLKEMREGTFSQDGLPPGDPNSDAVTVPLKQLAKTLGLPIHERDTFTGWDMPKYKPDEPSPVLDPLYSSDGTINLIIAVSFGLFVPPRLLSAAKYGGLNVHPSLLPEFRGPAPIHHTLLNGHTHRTTGVTLQTLSPVTFDAGTLLAQTPRPGFKFPKFATVPQLTAALATEGANMLIAGLRLGVHSPPHIPVEAHPPARNLLHAPKITAADRQVLWSTTLPPRIGIQAQVLGRLWTRLVVPEGKRGAGEAKRVVLEGVRQWGNHTVETLPCKGVTFAETTTATTPGELRRVTMEYLENRKKGSVFLRFPGVNGWRGVILEVDRITVDGKATRLAAAVLNEFWDGSVVRRKALEEEVVDEEVKGEMEGEEGERVMEGEEGERVMEDVPEAKDVPQKTPEPEVTVETPGEAGRPEEKGVLSSMKTWMYRV
ncbi:hypothetical protein B0T18DRAFT_444553 [Schizothecium vesticola]|uniref:methionyl-tRNA formyltransferase n=1 Tax=Schizothecium vesticola TaxID=314040 RepID=A0AA40F771_9PEZI|nr:hypothetical protein B0T18DRAFT_444553 [Schizothecium vesticola]